MNSLVVEDCLDPNLLRVRSEERYRDVARDRRAGQVFAVFEESRYLGLVTEKQVALFPNRIFADLMVLNQPDPISWNSSPARILDRMQGSRDGLLPVVDEAGDFLGVVSENSLVAAFSKLENALRSEKEALIRRLEVELENRRVASAVFEHSSEGILVASADALIILANQSFAHTSGYSVAELIGARPGLLTSGCHDRRFLRVMRHDLQRTGEWSGQIWSRHKNGEIYAEWLHVNAVLDQNGNLTHYVGIFSDISNQSHIQHNLRELAYSDILTGLPNRRLFYDRLAHAIEETRNSRVGFGLLFVDFDRFKDVNDSLGHGFGDKLLQAATIRLRETLRETDLVARLGGDEFTILLKGVESESTISPIVAGITEAFQRPLEVDARKIFLTASIGIARCPHDGADVETLMKNADAAMYRAKEDGRNRYCFFTTKLNTEVSERLSMEHALRSALQASALSLAWQPVVRLKDGLVVGLEALTRWHDPELGSVPPGEFIALAERVGLMQSFGNWSLKAIAAEVERLSEIRKHHPLRFAVNVSAVQIYDDETLSKQILQVLEQTGLSAQDLILEITETAFMGRGRSAEALAKLTDLGIQIAIDDFGTGYSNLGYLKRFAINRLKIDQSFVRELAEDATSRQIVKAIIQMAHSLQIPVIAEGVETAAQRAILLELGCDEGQGYFFGRPMELSRILELDFSRSYDGPAAHP